MKKLFLAVALFGSLNLFAQDDIPVIKLQFMTHLYNSQKNFRALRTDSVRGENEKMKYYYTTEALGARYINVMQSKQDTSLWYYYVEYPMETAEDLKDVGDVEPHVFNILNLYVKTGRLKGDEKTEGDIVRTNLYIAKTDEWFGELVTDNAKKKFYILLSNSRWE